MKPNLTYANISFFLLSILTQITHNQLPGILDLLRLNSLSLLDAAGCAPVLEGPAAEV